MKRHAPTCRVTAGRTEHRSSLSSHPNCHFPPAGRKHVKNFHLLKMLVFGSKKSGKGSLRGSNLLWRLVHFSRLRQGPQCIFAEPKIGPYFTGNIKRSSSSTSKLQQETSTTTTTSKLPTSTQIMVNFLPKTCGCGEAAVRGCVRVFCVLISCVVLSTYSVFYC